MCGITLAVVIGDADAELYEKHADELVRFATGIVGPDDAFDVVANAVVRVFTSSAWRRVSNRKSYLYRAVLNEGRMHLRAGGRRSRRETRAAELVPAPDVDIAIHLRAAIANLPVRQRAVVVLTYWEDLRPDEIAHRLGLSSRTVRRELGRAHATLRRYTDD